MYMFTIFSKAGCPYCDRTKEVMHKLNLRYTAYELERGDYTKDEFFERFGPGATFPRVIYTEYIKGTDGEPTEHNQIVGGMQETIKFLKSKNYI